MINSLALADISATIFLSKRIPFAEDKAEEKIGTGLNNRIAPKKNPLVKVDFFGHLLFSF